MKKLEIQYDLKPNGAVIRINNSQRCIFRICGIPKELVFDENDEVKDFVDIVYPNEKTDSITYWNKNQIIDTITRWSKWGLLEGLNKNKTNNFVKDLAQELKENPVLESKDGTTTFTFNNDVIDHMEKNVDIYAKRGTAVKLFMRDGEIFGGYDGDKKMALKFLKPDTIYHIKRTDVSDWHTDIYLEEISDPEIGFNSVMFEHVNE